MKRKRWRITVIKAPAAIRGAMLLLVLFAVLRLMGAAGVGGAAARLLKSAVSAEDAASTLLQLERGGAYTEPEKSARAVTPGVIGDVPEAVYYVETESSAAPLEKLAHSVIFDGTLTAEALAVKNNTDIGLELDKLLNEAPSLGDDPTVLIVHTHGSEAYSPDGEDVYTESDPYRTEDMDYNVVRVGDELAEALTERGVSVIHDRGLYDYPSYTGSYSRSLEAIEGYLAENESIKLVLDVHRDAIETDDGEQYKTLAQTVNAPCAQILLIVGTDYSGMEHPDWRENMKLALRLQYAMDVMYPSLSRPLCVSQYRYNQNVSDGALIVEVGTAGNTLAEALSAVRLFADAAAEVIVAGK